MAMTSSTTQDPATATASFSPADRNSDAQKQQERAQTMFEQLLKVTTESAHHDFKVHYTIDSRAKKRDFARDVVAMYNGLGDRYQATNGKPKSASYLLIGVKNKQIEDRGPVNSLVPLATRLDQAMYQDIVLSRIRPFVEVLYHDIRGTDKRKMYGLIEVRRGEYGPAAYYPNASERAPKEVLTRVDGRNVSKNDSNADSSLWREMENQFDQHYDKDCWRSLEPVLQEGSKGAIHVLVTTGLQDASLSRDTSPNRRDLVGMALGNLPWNFVIDLDNESFSSGLSARMSRYLVGKRDIKRLLYDEIEKFLLPSSKGASAESDFFNTCLKKTIWIFAKGDKLLDGSRIPRKQAQFSQPISNFFSRLFKSIQQPQPVLCVSLVTTNDQDRDVPKILVGIEDAYDSATENIGEDALTFVNVVAERSFLASFTDEETPSQRHKASVLPLNHFVPGMLDCYGVDTGVAFIKFPCSTGASGAISNAVYVRMSQSVELYHSDYGSIKEDADCTDDKAEENEALKDDIVLKFLQGGQITAEALFISEKRYRLVCVPRSRADTLEKSIRKRLKFRPFFKRKQGTIFTLRHLSSAGGTTSGRSILWNLRKEFPCMEVKSIDENLYASLGMLSKESGLPLLLLFDRSFDRVALAEVKNQLSSAVTNAVLLHVRRVTKTQAEEANVLKEDDYNAFMTSKLDQCELPVFRQIYDKYVQVGFKTRFKKHAKKTFLFGLYAFAEEFPKIDEHVVQCIANCNDQQKAVLRVSSLLSRYTQRPTPTALVSLTLDLRIHANVEDVEAALAEAGEILIPKKLNSGEGFDLPHDCVIDKVWRTAMPNPDRNPTPGELLQQSLTDFRELTRHTGVEMVRRVAEWLFVERKTSFFSMFIEDYEKEFGKSETSKLLAEIADCFNDSPHFRGHYARYLMFRVENGDQAIEQIKNTITLFGRQSTDSVLLAMYGDLVREQLRRQFKLAEADVPSLLQLATDGISAYKKAREHAETSSSPSKAQAFAYTGEARLRVMLLKYQKDKNLKLDDYLFGDSEKRTLEILDELERLISTHIIPDLNVDATRRHLLTVRIQLFELRQDPTSSIFYLQSQCTSDEEICSLPYIIRAQNERGGWQPKQKLRRWSELRYHELDIIINKLKTRHESQTRHGTRLTSDFNDMLNAMISIRQCCSQRERKDLNLDLAIEYAKQWKREYPKNHRPYFLIGVFLFVQAAQSMTPRPDLEKDSLASLKTCRERCQEMPHGEDRIQGYAKWKYYVGTKPGLAGVMDRDHSRMSDIESGSDETSLWEARPFEGVLQPQGNYVSVSLAGRVPVSARVTPSSRNDSLFLRREQTPRVSFSLVFSYKGMQAMDLREL